MKKLIIISSFLLLATTAFGQTPNVVPRADSEGSIGTSSKYWNNAYSDFITTTGSVSVGGTLAVTDEVHIKGVNGELKFGDGTDYTQTMIRKDRAGSDATIGFNESLDQFEVNFPLVTTGTATIDNTGIQLYAHDAAVVTGTMGMIPVASDYNTWLVNDMLCGVYDQGVTGTTDITLWRRRSGANVEVFSTDVTIGAEQYAADGVVNTSNDDLVTGDILVWEVTGIHSGTAPNGLSCTLTLWSE